MIGSTSRRGLFPSTTTATPGNTASGWASQYDRRATRRKTHPAAAEIMSSPPAVNAGAAKRAISSDQGIGARGLSGMFECKANNWALSISQSAAQRSGRTTEKPCAPSDQMIAKTSNTATEPWRVVALVKCWW